MATGRYASPIGSLSQCAANGTRPLMATITFLGEPQDIFDPGTAEPVAGPTTDANVVLSPKQPTDDLPGDARQVVRGRLRDFTVRSTKINSSPWAPSSKTARTAAVIRVPRNQLSRGHCRGHIDPAPLDEVAGYQVSTWAARNRRISSVRSSSSGAPKNPP